LAHFLCDVLGQYLLFAQEAGGGGGGLADWLFSNPMIPLLVTVLVFYMLMLRPDHKKRKEMEQRLAAIKKNDHIVTIGGIYGTVVAALPDSKFITIRVDDSNGTKLKILRSAVSQVGATDDAEGESKIGE
jgi:preprotein translocase subunit YajC